MISYSVCNFALVEVENCMLTMKVLVGTCSLIK